MAFAAHVHQLPAPIRFQRISAPGQDGLQPAPRLAGLAREGETFSAARINLAQHAIRAGNESVNLSRQSDHGNQIEPVAVQVEAVANPGSLRLGDPHSPMMADLARARS